MTAFFALWSLVIAADAASPPLPDFAIGSVTTAEPVVALTFDACATKRQANGFDRRIWDVLASEQIPVTFYLTGRWVEQHPTASRLIATAPWVEIGNHSYSHPRLTLVRKDRLRAQIRRTSKILEKRFGRPVLTLRPPAGAWNAKVVRAAKAEHLPVAVWSVVSGDAGGHVPPARIVRTVLDQAKPGAIIVFHINQRAPFTKKALPDIIAGLRDKGLRFVTVSQLLALPDAVPVKAKAFPLGYHVVHHPAQQEPGENHANPPT
jgi:peptidoglycan-N-acetylglucosamine deacetylase